MEQLSFKINEVEGPLDLILQLIAKHKLNIYDIEISKLVEQYLAYIQRMQEQDLEVGSAFLEMAARLVHIKTVELLPKHREETEELRQELTGQLLEYRACKQAAALLQRQSLPDDLFTRAPMPIQGEDTYRLTHPVQLLVDSYLAALGHGKRRLPPPTEVFTPIVARRVVSVNSRIVYILGVLYERHSIGFSGLFAGPQERSERVATFLALLELIRDKRVLMADDDTITLGSIRREQP